MRTENSKIMYDIPFSHFSITSFISTDKIYTAFYKLPHFAKTFLSLCFYQEMSVGYNESQNYIWNVQSKNGCLGEGTYGKVYRGVHKRTGDKVAVKVFKFATKTLTQEIKMLQSLNHEYIIKLHAIEIEELNKTEILIMELCNGGSLMDFLNQPENSFGLVDCEFLRVLEHLSGGLEYLKRHNVIHRDVKPDNIMRHIHDDGRIIYKLADFGTARELPEGTNFFSLHGTEPYLNPQIFKVCFFGDDRFPRKFGPNSDLWSIGVTLYQIATGILPFRIQDRRIMLMVYEKMARNEDIISACQVNDNVEYQTALPETSRLSLGLKTLVTPVIAGLFKQSKSQWSFTQYYEHASEVLSTKLIKVFYVNKMQVLSVYVHGEDKFSDFKHYLYQQTAVSGDNQVFLYKKTLIVNCFEDFDSIDSEYVFLFDRSNSNVVPVSNIQLNFQILSNFHQNFATDSHDDELRLSYLASKDLCLCKNLIEYQCIASKLFDTFIKDFNVYCKEEQNDLQKVYKTLLEKYASVNIQVKTLNKLQNLSQVPIGTFTEQFKLQTDNFTEEASKLFDGFSSAVILPNFNASHESYLRIVVTELSEMKDIRQQLFVGSANKKLYDYEKVKLLRCVRTIMEILTDKMEPDFECFVNDVKLWYADTFFSHVRQLSDLKRKIHVYGRELKSFEKEVEAESNENLKMIRVANKSVLNKGKLRDLLESYKRNTLDMKSIIEENVRLVEQMNQLVLAVESDVSDDLQESFV